MLKATFKSSLKNLIGHLYNYQTGANESFVLSDDGSFSFDELKYNRIYFSNDKVKTHSFPINNLATNFSYDVDKNIGRIEAKAIKGQLEIVELRDEENLYYLEDPVKEIFIYTPAGYDSTKEYPLLVSFDGQSLFDALLTNHPKSKYGSYELEKIMSLANENGVCESIIVGIDNSTIYRQKELVMSEENFGEMDDRLDDGDISHEGTLEAFSNFIFKTLKPYLYKHYALTFNLNEIGLMGSSCGGLAAFYLSLKNPLEFGYAICLSPAIGVFKKDGWYRFFKHLKKKLPRMYIYCGYNPHDDNDLDEIIYETMLAPLAELRKIYPKQLLKTAYALEGLHHESFWSLYFTEGYLFGLDERKE